MTNMIEVSASAGIDNYRMTNENKHVEVLAYAIMTGIIWE